MGEPSIACTLSPDELRATADSLLPGLIRDGRRLTPLRDGLRFELDVPPNAGAFTLTVTGPEGSAPLFADLAALGQSIVAD